MVLSQPPSRDTVPLIKPVLVWKDLAPHRIPDWNMYMESSVVEAWNKGLHSYIELLLKFRRTLLLAGKERYVYGKLMDGILESGAPTMLLCYIN
jgi:hypothetical protein